MPLSSSEREPKWASTSVNFSSKTGAGIALRSGRGRSSEKSWKWVCCCLLTFVYKLKRFFFSPAVNAVSMRTYAVRVKSATALLWFLSEVISCKSPDLMTLRDKRKTILFAKFWYASIIFVLHKVNMSLKINIIAGALDVQSNLALDKLPLHTFDHLPCIIGSMAQGVIPLGASVIYIFTE